MIVKKRMWRVHELYEPMQCDVLFQDDKNKVVCYFDLEGEEVYLPDDGDEFFDGNIDADECHASRILSMKRDVAISKSVFDNYTPSELETIGIKTDDLGYYIKNLLEKIKQLRNQADKYYVRSERLSTTFRTGWINVAGVKFKKEDVKNLKFSKKKIRVILDSEYYVESQNEEDVLYLRKIFGDNDSGYEVTG